MTGIVQANYELLDQLAQRFDRQADQIQQLYQRVQMRVAVLENGGWVGRGAEAFYAEMDDLVTPGLRRLVDALAQSGLALRQVSEACRQAEERSADLFRGGGWMAPGPGDASSPGGQESPVPIVGGGLLGIVELLKGIGVDIPLISRINPVLGTVLDAWGNPDGDWAKSIGSAGIANAAELIPPVGVAAAISDVVQFAGWAGSGVDTWNNGMIGTSPEMVSSLNNLSGRYYDNIERLDLNNMIEPLADAVYEYTVTPYTSAYGAALSQPGVENLLRLGATLASPPGMSAAGFLQSPEAQRGVLQGLWDFLKGAVNFVFGAADLQASAIDRGLAQGAAQLIHATDNLPIPDRWEQAIDGGAAWFIEKLDKGFIPSVNLPGIPVF